VNRKKIISSAAIISVIILSCYLFYRDAGSGPGLDTAGSGGQQLSPGSDPFSDRIVHELQKYYGGTISDKATQASIIGVRDLVEGARPADGRALFLAILQRSFPDYSGDIMETLDKLDEYNRWLEENKERLLRMSAAERAAAMWEKRKELFGEDAERIWSGEMLAAEARNAQVQDTIVMLNESTDTSIDEKLHMYRDILRETYEGSPEEYILEQNELLSKVFFSMDSVQEELKQMSPEQRQAEIDRIRGEMGFTGNQIESMARRDADNQRRWDIGLEYMEERGRIVREFQGREQEERLKALRERYFLDEAGTIELEEKDGFFRFERPRIYGRN